MCGRRRKSAWLLLFAQHSPSEFVIRTIATLSFCIAFAASAVCESVMWKIGVPPNSNAVSPILYHQNSARTPSSVALRHTMPQYSQPMLCLCWIGMLSDLPISLYSVHACFISLRCDGLSSQRFQVLICKSCWTIITTMPQFAKCILVEEVECLDKDVMITTSILLDSIIAFNSSLVSSPYTPSIGILPQVMPKCSTHDMRNSQSSNDCRSYLDTIGGCFR